MEKFLCRPFEPSYEGICQLLHFQEDKPTAEVLKTKGVHVIVYFGEFQMEIKGEYANAGNLNLNSRSNICMFYLNADSEEKPLLETFRKIKLHCLTTVQL